MIRPSSVSIVADVVTILLLPNGPNGTAVVTERYSGSMSDGDTEVASVTIHSVEGGLVMIMLFVTKGCRFWNVVWSCSKSMADFRSMVVGRRVCVMTDCVDVRTICRYL